MNNKMQIKQLKHLMAVAEQGSFGRAAEVVHLSQPALSRSIDSLEASLDAPLVDRSYGSVRLTPAGEMVVARAQRMLQDVDEIRRDVRRLQALELGELRVGLGSFAATLLGQPALASLVRQHPQLRLRIEVGDVAQLKELLERRLLDILLIDTRNLEHLPGLHIERLPDIAVGFFTRADHPVQARAKPVLADLLAYPVAAPHLPERVLQFFERKLKTDLRSLFTIACNDLATLRLLALHSDTVVLIPMAPGLDMLSASLKPVNLAGLDSMATHYGLVRSRQWSTTPAVQAFESQVRRLVGQPA